ncbi:ABC transporter ATP-binding protein [Bradyrhizobium sp. 149]|uniref:ABC transporter ATP-binding protein n=1 Tax=Bradyrhizobium sp. 149 TaxID=2782624 RepID=UPI001FF728E1|nr:ABC transporter ATP-binding protein [Bradyrhizobium sp. 149]MCK1651583.1 ABC transporter ATP-binding protein [Bradyrhizobium sp. 149]
MTAVLEIRGLTVGLTGDADGRRTIRDIDITVPSGEIVCVVGESGSGKSVTAFSVMGLLPDGLTPMGGSIKVLGEELIGAPDQRMRTLRGSRIGMIFQEPMTALNPVMTVREQLAELLVWHGNARPSKAEINRRVLAALEDMLLPNAAQLMQAYPHQLSGGQRQRVMIAMAMLLEPVLLIADEPTTALDVTTQKQILVLIKDLVKRKNIGVLFITHDFGVVADIADRVVVMQKGAVVESGSADAVLGSPAQAYTRLLIDSVPKGIQIATAAREPTADVLAVKGLEMTYGQRGLFGRGRVTHAVRGAGFTLGRGEILGVVGESGSGKSTLARCVARLMKPTSGEINLLGTDIAAVSNATLRPHRRYIQVVFQDPYRSLNPRLSVGQSMIEGVVNFGASPQVARDEVAKLLELVGMDPHVMHRFPHEFSGGQRQRICIARALASEPQVLIADEAVSALDVTVQAQVLKLFADLRSRLGLAMLFITHDLRVAGELCDRIMVMKSGEIVESGPTADIFANPQHAYTRALFAAAPGRERLQ